MENTINPQFHSLFQDFYTITGIRTGICDLNYQPLTNVKAVDLCHFFHKMYPDSYDICVQCDHWAINKALSTKKGFLFRCPLGLMEYGTPLFSGDTIIGYASTGMITDGSENEKKLILGICDRFGLNREEAMRYYDMQKHRSHEEIRAVCSVFETCVSHIYYQNSVRLKEIGKIADIEEYITENLQENINIRSLCEKFNISKAELYSLIRNRANCGVAEFVKGIRIRAAKHLLLSTNLSVSEVALKTGFDNYSYFTKIFKSEYNCTPRDYRKKNQSEIFIDRQGTFDTLSTSDENIPMFDCFE